MPPSRLCIIFLSHCPHFKLCQIWKEWVDSKVSSLLFLIHLVWSPLSEAKLWLFSFFQQQFYWDSPIWSVPPMNFGIVTKLCKHHAKLLQSCLSLCDPLDCSPTGSTIHGILQARILEWVAISFSRGSSQLRDRTLVSFVSCIGRRVLYH